MKKTLAFTINRQNILEADRLLTLLTFEYGKIKAIAKSARKIKSKMSAHLEPAILTEIYLVKGKNFNVITSARAKRIYKIDHSDLNDISFVYLMMEMINKLIPLEQKNYQVFNLFKECLDHLEKIKELGLIKQYFYFKFLVYTGHNPNLIAKEGSNQFFLDFANGNIITTKPDYGRRVTKDIIKLWRLITSDIYSQVAKVKIKDNIIKESQQVIEEFYQYHFDLKPKSSSILK